MKEIFDKKFVHFMWDDSLDGKEGIVSDSIASLVIRVNDAILKTVDGQSIFGDVSYGDSDHPFLIEGIHYRFFYSDPLYDVKLAWKQGKTIQYKSHYSLEWRDCDDPKWSEDYEYRVKPEKKWRPFKDIQELKQTWEIKRGPLVYSELEEPDIWVRSKSNQKSTYLITHYCENMGVIYLCGYLNTGLEQLFEDYTFLDGTPCGVEE